MMPGYPNASLLAEADWLNAHIADEDLRVIDARFDFQWRKDGTFEEISGRTDYAAGHIPGAQFVDLRTDLTEPGDPTSIVGSEAFAALMSKLGVGSHSTVVIYDDKGGIWAARLWWALRYYGHDDAKILNGGLASWLAADYELQQDIVKPTQSPFEVSVRPHLRVAKEDVMSGIEEPATCIVDALPRPFYLGMAGLFPHHRKGHIPGAHNLPAASNLDPDTLRIRTMDELRELWGDCEIRAGQTIITYCGSGVFASFALFTLVLMGYEKVALYDASWMEWGADNELPVETGDMATENTNN